LEVAQWLRVSKQTLMRWRVSGAGPAWLSLGGIPRYLRGDVDAYLAEVRSGGRPAS
ncbi:helix-turn-helix domain-containing protein, partial [Naasia sp.]|uniref:helix-turn-helix transcriptional regulator n=1 Tax=Naasia sp. TaxID=2546198 RepID=UPI00260BA93B